MRAWIVRALAAVIVPAALMSCSSSEKSTGLSGPPVLTSVNGAALPAGPIGSVVVIAGSNFGATQAVASGVVLFTSGSGLVDTAAINAAADWSATLIVTTVPAGAITGAMQVKTSGGMSDTLHFTVTQQAAFSPSTVSWTALTSLQLGVSGEAVASTFAQVTPLAYQSQVYVLGGADSTNVPNNQAYYATIASGATLSTWAATTALPQALAFATAVIASPYNSPVAGAGFLYLIGGDSTASGKPVSTVYVGTLNAPGGVSGWTTTTPLPAPLHSVGAAIFHGYLYVVGGSGTGNVPVATVYRAKIGATGALGTWQTLPPLPFARSYFGFGLNGTFLYALGGDSATKTPNDSSISPTAIGDVAYAQIDPRTGNLTAAGWTTSPNKLTKVASKHTAVVAGGAVLVTGGLYNGASTGSTEESYATLNADGTTSSFQGATGSNTIKSAGGGNLFNHAATGYVDASGAFHVIVVGGDDVSSPTKKHTGVWRY